MTGVQDLPQRLEDALDALEGDALMRTSMGEEFIKLFVAVKRHEIGKAQAAIPEYNQPTFLDTVTDWERSEYFEFL